MTDLKLYIDDTSSIDAETIAKRIDIAFGNGTEPGFVVINGAHRVVPEK